MTNIYLGFNIVLKLIHVISRRMISSNNEDLSIIAFGLGNS